jgi:anti-anti-sigma factor
VLLNFADVEYINSTGIALIVGLLARARKHGTRVLAAGLSEHYREIFEITRLADFMELYPDEEGAVAVESTADQGRTR